MKVKDIRSTSKNPKYSMLSNTPIFVMSRNFRVVKVKVDVPYLMKMGEKIRQVRFVPTTERGFNFEEEGSYRKVFKKHIYPNERDRENLKVATITLHKDIKLKENGI